MTPTENLPALREDHHGVLPLARVGLPSLYDVEDDLIALLDSEATVTPEQEAEFKADLARQLNLAVRKRDSVAGFITECENHADFAAQEIRRLQARKGVFMKAAERLRVYVAAIIEQLPQDAKGKPAKLQGERFQMSIRACPASLDITDAEKVPLTYKNVTVTMPAVAYEVIRAYLEFGGVGGLPDFQGVIRNNPGDDQFDFAKLPVNWSIDNAAVKAELVAGREVPGADLRIGGVTLVVK